MEPYICTGPVNYVDSLGFEKWDSCKDTQTSLANLRKENIKALYLHSNALFIIQCCLGSQSGSSEIPFPSFVAHEVSSAINLSTLYLTWCKRQGQTQLLFSSSLKKNNILSNFRQVFSLWNKLLARKTNSRPCLFLWKMALCY